MITSVIHPPRDPVVIVGALPKFGSVTLEGNPAVPRLEGFSAILATRNVPPISRPTSRRFFASMAGMNQYPWARSMSVSMMSAATPVAIAPVGLPAGIGASKKALETAMIHHWRFTNTQRSPSNGLGIFSASVTPADT